MSFIRENSCYLYVYKMIVMHCIFNFHTSLISTDKEYNKIRNLLMRFSTLVDKRARVRDSLYTRTINYRDERNSVNIVSPVSTIVSFIKFALIKIRAV